MSTHDRPDYDTNLVARWRCSRDCLFSVEGNFYPVLAEYATRQMAFRISEKDELSVLNRRGEIFARHRRALESK